MARLPIAIGVDSHQRTENPDQARLRSPGHRGTPHCVGGEMRPTPGQSKECFKAFMGAASFSNGPNTVPGGPDSQLELHRWVRDYLGAFCAAVVDFIDHKAVAGWRDATVIWNFSVPGSWAVFPVVADFKRLAGDAVSSCFPNAKDFRIFTDVTEATASALCLLATSLGKDKQYSIGNTVISCDIGGATTDVAVSSVSSAGRLATWPQSKTESVGMVTVDIAFWLHARHTLRSAGAQNPDQLALEMARGKPFQHAKAVFTRHQNEDRVRIKLPMSCNVQKWSPSETPSSSMSVIDEQRLCIHRYGPQNSKSTPPLISGAKGMCSSRSSRS
jgi:hypothetical protein